MDDRSQAMEPVAGRFMPVEATQGRLRRIGGDDTSLNRNDLRLHGLQPETAWSRWRAAG